MVSCYSEKIVNKLVVSFLLCLTEDPSVLFFSAKNPVFTLDPSTATNLWYSKARPHFSMPSNAAFIDLYSQPGLGHILYSPQANLHLGNGNNNQYSHSDSPKSGGPSPIESLNSLSPGGHSNAASSNQMSPQQSVPVNNNGNGGPQSKSASHSSANGAAGKDGLFDGKWRPSGCEFFFI